MTWIYDNKYLLTTQQATVAYATLTYDAIDNTLVKWHQGLTPLTMTYDAASRLTTSIQGIAQTTYTYNPAGSETLQNTLGALITSVYDGENRLLTESGSNGITMYTYQGDGLRRSAFEAGKSLVTTVWDGGDYLGGVS